MLYDRQPRKNLHTAISLIKPKLSVTKHDQTLLWAHMYDTSRYTANTKMYCGILHTHTHPTFSDINLDLHQFKNCIWSHVITALLLPKWNDSNLHARLRCTTAHLPTSSISHMSTSSTCSCFSTSLATPPSPPPIISTCASQSKKSLRDSTKRWKTRLTLSD